jgi:hypothetical protein
VASSTSAQKKKIEFLDGRQKHPWFHFPPFSPLPLIFPLPLPFLSQSRQSIVHPAPVPLRLPLTLRRASLSPRLSRLDLRRPTRDPKRPVLRQPTHDTKRPVLWRPKASCSPATQTVIRVFWVFFFFILFGYVGEKESCFGVWFSQGVISGGPLVFGFLRYRPKPRSFGFVFFSFSFSLFLYGVWGFVICCWAFIEMYIFLFSFPVVCCVISCCVYFLVV